MAITTFTNGQVLTAAQQNALQANDYNQTVSTKTADYVLVAADKGTRVAMNAAGSTTITVNTDLFAAGDSLAIHNIGAGVCTVTAGTATVTSSGSLAIPQWGSGTLYFTSAGASIWFPSQQGGLHYITGASFSAVSSVSLPTNTFTSTYANYKIIFVVLGCSVGGTLLQFRLRTSGTDNSAASYFVGLSGVNIDAGTVDILRSTSGTFCNLVKLNGTFANVAIIDMIGPVPVNYTNWTAQTFGLNIANTELGAFSGAGIHNSLTVFDSMTFSPAFGAVTFSGTYKIYGYSNS